MSIENISTESLLREIKTLAVGIVDPVYKQALNEFIRRFEITKAAFDNGDVAKVVHGRWIWTITGEEDYEQYYRCSECNDSSYIEYNYCPNCGAKMDGGNEDG